MPIDKDLKKKIKEEEDREKKNIHEEKKYKNITDEEYKDINKAHNAQFEKESKLNESEKPKTDTYSYNDKKKHEQVSNQEEERKKEEALKLEEQRRKEEELKLELAKKQEEMLKEETRIKAEQAEQANIFSPIINDIQPIKDTLNNNIDFKNHLTRENRNINHRDYININQGHKVDIDTNNTKLNYENNGREYNNEILKSTNLNKLVTNSRKYESSKHYNSIHYRDYIDINKGHKAKFNSADSASIKFNAEDPSKFKTKKGVVNPITKPRIRLDSVLGKYDAGKIILSPFSVKRKISTAVFLANTAFKTTKSVAKSIKGGAKSVAINSKLAYNRILNKEKDKAKEIKNKFKKEAKSQKKLNMKSKLANSFRHKVDTKLTKETTKDGSMTGEVLESERQLAKTVIIAPEKIKKASKFIKSKVKRVSDQLAHKKPSANLSSKLKFDKDKKEKVDKARKVAESKFKLYPKTLKINEEKKYSLKKINRRYAEKLRTSIREQNSRHIKMKHADKLRSMQKQNNKKKLALKKMQEKKNKKIFDLKKIQERFFKNESLKTIIASSLGCLGSLAVLILILFFIFQIISVFFLKVATSSYLTTDNDVTKADLIYQKCEALIEERYDKLEEYYPGYDFYNKNHNKIGHDPTELIAYLTVKYQEFDADELESVMEDIFNEVYEFEENVVERTDENKKTTTTFSLKVTNKKIKSLVEKLDDTDKEYFKSIVEARGNFEQFEHIIAKEGVGIEKGKEADVYEKAQKLPENVGLAKTWMGYQAITNTSSKQYELQQRATTDENGLRRYNGLPMVAVAEKFANVGDTIKVTLSTKAKFWAVVGDVKARQHVDEYGVHLWDGSVVEFIVDEPIIRRTGVGNIAELLPEYKGYVVEIATKKGANSDFKMERSTGDWKENAIEKYGWYYDTKEGLLFRDHITVKTKEGEGIYAPFNRAKVTLIEDGVMLERIEFPNDKPERVGLKIIIGGVNGESNTVDNLAKIGDQIGTASGTKITIKILSEDDSTTLNPYFYLISNADSKGTIYDPNGFNFTGFVGDIITRDNVVYYSQYDPRWNGHPWNIAPNGCGPTSMAMAISTLTGNTVTPLDTATVGLNNGQQMSDGGCSWGLFPITAQAYGLRCTQIASGYDLATAKTWFEHGALIILSGQSLNGNGHIMMATGIENGLLKLHDPASFDRTHLEVGSVGTYAIKGMWAIYRY